MSSLPGDDSQVSATLDSEYRFTSTFWFATAPVIWSALPRVEQEPAAPGLRRGHRQNLSLS
jgi:hypothetical protein